MRSIGILSLLFLTAGCVSYQPTFPSTEGSETESLHVLPILHQEEVAVQVVVADSSAATAQYGALGALIGAIVDSAVNNSRAKKAERKAEVLRSATVDYDLTANLVGATTTEADGNGWTVQSVGDVTGDTETRKLVADVFADSAVDTVVVLTASYQLTPSIDQVHVSIRQEVFPRSKLTSSNRAVPSSFRVMAYQSPHHPITYRPFRDGEKEEIKQAIAYEYEQSITTQPDEEDDLRKALAKELEEIDAATEIPEDRAIAETWTADRLSMYLDEANTHLRFMLEHDWNERTKLDMASENLEPFFAVTTTGIRAKQKGRSIGSLDSNTIYRTAAGTLYSVPPSAE